MRKMDIKVSERDKKMLIILLAVVIGFLCYTFIMSPALTKGSELKAKAVAASAELKRVKNLIGNLSTIQTQESDKKQEISKKYEQFFYDLNQEQILYKFDTLFAESGMSVSSYTPSKQVVASIPANSKLSYITYPLLDLASKSNFSLTDPIYKIKAEKTATETTTQTTLPADAVPTYDVTINFNSTSYASIMTFIRKLEEMNKSIVIKKIDLRKSDVNLNGQIILTLYSLPKVDEKESEYLKFLPSVGTGKPDPFQ